MRLAAAPSPASWLAGFLAAYDPAIRRLARAARAKLRGMMPAATELVYDNYNALVMGYGPTERASDAIVSLALYPRWVSLFFLQGAALPDPGKLLQGSGTVVRHIVLRKAADLDAPAVRRLLGEALARAKVRLPPGGGGRTLIKSVSAKQRYAGRHPRRRLPPVRRRVSPGDAARPRSDWSGRGASTRPVPPAADQPAGVTAAAARTGPHRGGRVPRSVGATGLGKRQ